MLSLPEVRPFFQKILDEGLSFPEKQQWNAAYFSKGYLLIITLEPYPEPEIFQRFAKVFEQTYTRFLDLQKAEAQAREAQIEGIGTCAIPHHGHAAPDELTEASEVLDQQVRALGIETWGCAFIFMPMIRKATMNGSQAGREAYPSIKLLGKVSS